MDELKTDETYIFMFGLGVYLHFLQNSQTPNSGYHFHSHPDRHQHFPNLSKLPFGNFQYFHIKHIQHFINILPTFHQHLITSPPLNSTPHSTIILPFTYYSYITNHTSLHPYPLLSLT